MAGLRGVGCERQVSNSRIMAIERIPAFFMAIVFGLSEALRT
jgi:hypothetical protein